MKPTAEQIIDWGRTALNETGALIPTEWNMKLLEAICSAAYEAGRKDENEACAQVCDEQMAWGEINKSMAVAAGNCADLIRERREQ